ncbi:MAG: UDP-N-acetylmuramoyl-L-alanine--D-glutamate ligase [Actinobacteria bacterium]|nr:UDP-N-acetylmuramoyl-L-alanine--D-glutamate ligase [Actinomycetota bacterium]
MTGEAAPPFDGRALVLGLGVTGRAVARALGRRGGEVVLADDRPGPGARDVAEELGVPLEVAPTEDRLAALLDGCAAFVPSPGVPERHPAFRLAAERSVPRWGELDLAAAWDSRPCVAVTGTDGKTTVTTLVTRILEASGTRAADAGNTEVPLVEAIDDPWPQVFVVEASSFRLAPLHRFAPRVGAWLNFAPDHLDVHADVAGYESAKARLFELLPQDGLAVANAEDPVVARHAARAPHVQTFAAAASADWHVAAGHLVAPDGSTYLPTAELHRALPHDLANALAATATAVGAGATLDGAAAALRGFRGLPHRVELVGDAGGVRWYDDSKATAPHATLAAVCGFDSVVLIAGGRNKGLDLGALAGAAPHVRAVVAIGEASAEVAGAFAGVRPVRDAASMDEAVAAARDLAEPGDVVLLSPACASFDWYGSYAERGDDFARAAREVAGVVGPR